jgi:predicted permease
MQSLARLSHVNPGFNPSHLLTFRISLPPLRYNTNERQAGFFDQLVRRLESMPGVHNAAAAITLPMTGFARTPVQLADQLPRLLNDRPLAVIESVTPAYFRALEIPLKRGREFSERDNAGAPLTAVINESLARVLWPAYPNGLNPVGQRIVIGAKSDPVEIVGIVADIHQSLEWDPWPGVFRPFNQSPFLFAGLAVRTAGDPLQEVHAISNQVLEISRDQPASAFKTMEDLMESVGGQRRLILILLELFGGAALLLAVIGIYGVIAYSVVQRTPEMGIRRALGAQREDILWLVVSQGLVLTLAGIVLGMGAALALTRVIRSLLFHTSATDPVTFAGVALLFILAALAASYVPARRAAQIDPATALRIG